MSNSIKCDQAIFTSTRTPMGEGYRIIAASPGLKPDEKQAITRNSPSHDSLCSLQPDAQAAAFYPLPSGRLCAAVSRYAGGEHTGRGGQRIYTHNLVFDAAALSFVGFNPFYFIRVIQNDEAFRPQLTPSTAMPEFSLSTSMSFGNGSYSGFAKSLSSAARSHILQRLLDDGSLIVHLEQQWQECAEAIMLGLPGPMRAKVSLAAGMKFSVGRGHRLHILSDEKGVARTKVTGLRIEYVEPGAVQPTCADRSAWVVFVERLWSSQDFNALNARTSQSFPDIGPPARERIGRLFNFLDELSSTETSKLISRVNELMQFTVGGLEADIRDDFIQKTKAELTNRLRTAPWYQIKHCWPLLLSLWRRGTEGARIAIPLMHEMVRSSTRDNPLATAEMVLEVTQKPPSAAESTIPPTMIEEMLQALQRWSVNAQGRNLNT